MPEAANAVDYGNFLSAQDVRARQTSAYNALAKIYGPIAGDPQLAKETANAQTEMANAPNIQAANVAKAKALQQSIQDFGPAAGNPEAQQHNLANQDLANQNLRNAQTRAVKILGNSVDPATGAVKPEAYDAIIGANAKALGFTDSAQVAALRTQLTAPGGGQHLDTLAQGLQAPTMLGSGAPIITKTADGTQQIIRFDKAGNPIYTALPTGTETVQQQRVDTGNVNAATNKAKLPILQQNANTAAYSANTRSNNSNFGNPGGLAGQRGGGAAPPATGAANTHAPNADGSATTPTFEKLAPVGSKARATAIGTATQIVNQDTQLQSTNQVIGQVLSQISPYTAGTGALLKDLPASAQNNLHANLQNLKASGQMAWIASLKNSAGQTGIGRVLQSEAKNAETLFGNMEQDQDAKQLALHVRLFQATVNQLHNTAQSAFKAQWGQDPYALLGAVPGKGGSGGPAPVLDAATKAAYAKYGIPH